MGTFRKDGVAEETRPMEVWNEPKLSIKLTTGERTFERQAGVNRIALAITPASAEIVETPPSLTVSAGGHPTGIPVQLGKNWHVDAEAGAYSGQWFHGLTQLRLPAKSSIDLELVIASGPCLTEVTYSGTIGRNTGLRHSITASLARTDDVVRATYRLRLDVDQPFDFSRFAIFQHGADTYNVNQSNQFSLGNIDGLIHEWQSQPGGDAYRSKPRQATGKSPWISLHYSLPSDGRDSEGAWANRGIVIRERNAKLGGKPASPWIADYGASRRNHDSSTIDIVPPPGITRLEPGDFIAAIIESIVVPQNAGDYYGPNNALREALRKNANSWQMIHREAADNERRIEMKTGTHERSFPDVRIGLENNRASFTLTVGIGFVPVTFTGLTSARGYTLAIDGQPLDQSVHGNDYWQSDYDPVTGHWTRTYNVPASAAATQQLEFSRPDRSTDGRQ